MHVFIIPIWVLITVIILAWIGVTYIYWFRSKIKPKLDDYFAQRRHNRRIRKFANGSTLYDVNTTGKPQVYYAPARHRR